MYVLIYFKQSFGNEKQKCCGVVLLLYNLAQGVYAVYFMLNHFCTSLLKITSVDSTSLNNLWTSNNKQRVPVSVWEWQTYRSVL